MRQQEALLETAFQKIARIISSQYNINVVIRGTRAYIDMKTRTIVLPSLDSDAVKGIEAVLDGLLDHEVGHALFTDEKAVQDAKLGPQGQPVWNAIEDPMVERRLSERYYGCGQNLDAANDILFARVEKTWEKMGAWTRLVMALCAVADGRRGVEDYTGDPLIGKLVQLLEPEILESRLARTTADSIKVAKKILEKLHSAAEQPEPEEGTGDVQEGDEDDERGGDDGEEAGGDGDPSASPDSGDAGDDGEDSGAAEAAADGEAEGEEADASGAAGAGEPESGEDAGDDGAADAKPGASGDAPGEEPGEDPAAAGGLSLKEQAESACSPSGADLSAPGPSLEGLVEEHLTKFTKRKLGREPERYYVFSEEFDGEVEYTHEQRALKTSLYESLKGEVQRYIGTMASQLELALAARTQARWVGGELHGKRFDKRKLLSWTMGSDDERIYRVRVEGEKLDTAVSMLWDCSGSMGSADRPTNKAALARIAALAFHEALLRVQVPHEVLGFNTGGHVPPGLTALIQKARKAGEDLSIFSRLDETDNRFVFVPFGQNDGRAICHITGGAANRDGEAVLWAARRLAARPEARKVLLVGSDGQPQGARYNGLEREYLKEVVQKVTAAGIEVFGLGIMDESVKHYYPHWAVVKKADELPRAVMAQLIRHLTGPMGMNDGDKRGAA